MRRMIIYALILGAALLCPMEGTDAGKLHPVELIYIYKDGQTVIISTDTGAEGKGDTTRLAIENLKATTPGVVFLDTAEYLLYNDSAKEEIDQMKYDLKSTVRVCQIKGEVDLREATRYLATHEPSTRLKDLNASQSKEILMIEDGKMNLEEK